MPGFGKNLVYYKTNRKTPTGTIRDINSMKTNMKSVFGSKNIIRSFSVLVPPPWGRVVVLNSLLSFPEIPVKKWR